MYTFLSETVDVHGKNVAAASSNSPVRNTHHSLVRPRFRHLVISCSRLLDRPFEVAHL